MNRFDVFFSSEMSTKQITMKYFQLIDTVKDSERKDLYDAHFRAWVSANQRESDEFHEALKEGVILCY